MTTATNTATLRNDLIVVSPVTRADDGSHWLTVECPNGWDDVKKLTRKVVEFDGKLFGWISWNSDTNTSNFKENHNIAKVK